MKISLLDFLYEKILPHFGMIPVSIDTFVNDVRSLKKFDPKYFLVFVDDFKCKFRAKVQSNIVVMVEKSDTVFVDKEFSGNFLEVESVFE